MELCTLEDGPDALLAETNSNGQTALDYALDAGRRDCAELLRQFGTPLPRG